MSFLYIWNQESSLIKNSWSMLQPAAWKYSKRNFCGNSQFAGGFAGPFCGTILRVHFEEDDEKLFIFFIYFCSFFFIRFLILLFFCTFISNYIFFYFILIYLVTFLLDLNPFHFLFFESINYFKKESYI